ncbi:PREDICTED: thioredoxin reductase 1, cytoplasmic-like [Rhagoletis zephyria]|uniref:thioredoxin reductase 1, cytoplasmic-like n=1 Tax=Rhagoletis zephyria TaxID=28612 RepID=UPI00081174D1|nr:PREDICTED: thioredoxin reductase 1, cytoplasmic-like [Rhagoletis zephyria]
MPLIRGHSYEYDLVVIGGGSGGLAASKEAAAHGKKVALLDFVAPTPQGTTWGLGGTCVNVGCIPKKLMHHASLIGQDIEDAQFFGWQTKDGQPLSSNMKHDWTTLVNYVQNNIKSSNFGYRNALRDNKVKYVNALGSLVDAHTIKLKHKNGKEETMTSNHFLIATGERPKYPEGVEGALENAITSDDIFSLPYNPGKTLVIGASYVALECAGFLKGIGNDVTVMVRSIVLRGFDRQCSELVRSYLEDVEKVRFIDTSVPKKIVRLDGVDQPKPGKLAVTYANVASGEEKTEEFNTVLFAIGRSPCTDQIGLEAAGVVKDKSGYIPVVNEQTNVPNIYAVGDILAGKPQLTPVAIEAGVLLARRLYQKGADVQCDYLNVPTTVFTPLEYGCCGYTEEAATAEFGEENIDVYHQFFAPTEWRLNYYDRPRKPLNVCYVKVIPKEERLLGFHYVGPNAGEVTQFVGIPLKLKATKADLDALIGIHPTNAELFTTLTVTKRSGKDPTQQGCCG